MRRRNLPCENLAEIAGETNQTVNLSQRGPATQTPRSQLAKDVRDLRNNTNAPNSQIKQAIELNKQKYPEMRK